MPDVKMRRVTIAELFGDESQLGDFYIDNHRYRNDLATIGGPFIRFVCPRRPVRELCGVPLRNPLPLEGASWSFDGNMNSPTLHPSIHCSGAGGCGWHGFIRDGVMSDA